MWPHQYGIAGPCIRHEGSQELLHPHLPQGKVVEPQVIIALYTYIQHFLQLKTHHFGDSYLLLTYLHHAHTVEVLMQFEFAYLLGVEHFDVVEDEDYMVSGYLRLGLD